MSATTILDHAARIYHDRKTFRTSPDGRSDGSGRWYPTKAESQACCLFIREPSRLWPLSLRKHCCTAEHVASMFDIEKLELKRAARALTALGKAA